MTGAAIQLKSRARPRHPLPLDYQITKSPNNQIQPCLVASLPPCLVALGCRRRPNWTSRFCLLSPDFSLLNPSTLEPLNLRLIRPCHGRNATATRRDKPADSSASCHCMALRCSSTWNKSRVLWAQTGRRHCTGSIDGTCGVIGRNRVIERSRGMRNCECGRRNVSHPNRERHRADVLRDAVGRVLPAFHCRYSGTANEFRRAEPALHA